MIVVDEISDRKIMVGESVICLGENDIIYITVIGDIDSEKATKMNNAVLKLMNMKAGKIDVLADNTRAGKPSSEARNIMHEFILHEKYGKLAIYGLNPVSKIVASIFMGLSKKKDMHYFKTKEEALAWLKK